MSLVEQGPVDIIRQQNSNASFVLLIGRPIFANYFKNFWGPWGLQE